GDRVYRVRGQIVVVDAALRRGVARDVVVVIRVMNAGVRAAADEGSRHVVDVAAAGVAVDHPAHRQGIGDQRHIDHGGDVAAGIPMTGVGVAGIDAALGDVELGLVGDVAQYARLGTGAEQRALRALEHLDTLQVRRIDVE